MKLKRENLHLQCALSSVSFMVAEGNQHLRLLNQTVEPLQNHSYQQVDKKILPNHANVNNFLAKVCLNVSVAYLSQTSGSSLEFTSTNYRWLNRD